MLLFDPEVNFKFSTLEKEIGPLCTGGCEKMVCIAEIQVTSDALRWPARIFGDKMCSFAVIYLLRTLFVTLYLKVEKFRGIFKLCYNWDIFTIFFLLVLKKPPLNCLWCKSISMEWVREGTNSSWNFERCHKATKFTPLFYLLELIFGHIKSSKLDTNRQTQRLNSQGHIQIMLQLRYLILTLVYRS